MSEEPGIVIVGGGPAAKAAAAFYREAGGDQPVTIVGAENELPYERPPLSKEFLRGEAGRAELALQCREWYRRQEIELVLDVAIAELDLDSGEAVAADGHRFPFSRCLLATGARPLTPEIPGVDLQGVLQVRTIVDSERLAKLAGSELLVVGSGFIGCEAAVSLSMLGARVTIATLEPSPQVERLGEAVSERIASWLRGYGVTVLGEAELTEISADRSSLIARFEDGREKAADELLLALGIVRNVKLAAAIGIELNDGVPVNQAMVSAHPRLLAAGDVAFAHNSAAGRRLKVEHWGEALRQGEIAGRTMAGEEASWADAPGFWSTLGERTLKYAGWGDGWDEVCFERGEDQGFIAWYGKEDKLVAVISHERDDSYQLGKRLIEEGSPWR